MKKGFTLIELLVVIAIISGLATILLPNFMAVRERSRDTQRKSDLAHIRQAMELYKQQQNPVSYPSSLPPVGQKWQDTTTGVVFLNKFPGDPISGNDYSYTVDNSNLTFTLCACLENEADPDGIAGDCSAYSCPTGKKFEITEE